MLAAGALDALFSARAPSCFIDKTAPVERLFKDYQTAEKSYFQQTGIFPIMHALGIRKDVAEEHPWLPMSLCKAFEQAKQIAMQDMREVAAIKLTLPWLTSVVEETVAVMGEDFWPYGVDANRHVLEAMFRYSYEQGLSARQLEIEEVFVKSTLDHIRV